MEKPAAAAPAKPAPVPANTAANIANLLSSLKLPQDSLSRSVIAFARFFSLPLDSKLLNSLRGGQPDLAGKAAPQREAAALGAAAAADKGLQLDKKALAEYAAAIEGSLKSFPGKGDQSLDVNRPVHDREAGGGHGQGNAPDGEGESSAPKGGSGQNPGGAFGDSNRQGQGDRRQLQHELTELLKARPMLDFLNRVPGKKGRWIVVPFSFLQKGFEFNVSLRILLQNGRQLAGDAAERLTADITVKKACEAAIGEAAAGEAAVRESGIVSRWFICLEKPPDGADLPGSINNTGGAAQVKVYSSAAEGSPGEKGRLRKELAKALNLPLKRVEVIEKPLLFADSRIDHLRSVDEEV